MVFVFQFVGRLSWNLMSNAEGSIGRIIPKTLQYSPTTVGALPEGPTSSVAVTRPPLVGRPMVAAGMLAPLSSAHDDCALGVVGREELSTPMQAAMNATIKTLRKIRSELGKEVMGLTPAGSTNGARSRLCDERGPWKRHNDSEIRAVGIANRGSPMQTTTARVVRTYRRSLARCGRSLIMRCIDSRRCRNIVRGRLPGGFMQRLMLVSAVGALAVCSTLP